MAVHTVLKLMRWSEGHDPARLDWDLVPGLWIPSSPLGFIPNHEIPEAGKFHVLSSLQSIADLGQYLLGIG